MRPRLSIRTMLIAGALLSAGSALALPLKNSPPERENTVNLNDMRYVTAGDRAYLVGVQDGSQVSELSQQPANGIGWHITGQMGGVWAHPIKLLQEYQLFLNGTPLPAATKFVSGAGYVRLELPATQGMAISETQFAPDGLPVVLVGVQLQNLNTGTTSSELAITAQSEMITSFPWSGTNPTSESVHQQDAVTFDSTTGALQFTQPAHPSWVALVAAALDPQDRSTGFQSLGASALGPAGSRNGAAGTLTYRVTLAGHSSTTVWFAVAGSNVAKDEAVGALQLGLTSAKGLLNAKIANRQQVLAQANIQVPDPGVQAAFDWGKLDLASMRRSVRNVMARTQRKETRGPTRPRFFKSFPLSAVSGRGIPIIPGFSEQMALIPSILWPQSGCGTKQRIT